VAAGNRSAARFANWKPIAMRLRYPVSVSRHRSIIVFGVLVVVLGPDDVPGTGFFLG
jgi:hypothetical protein